MTDEATKVMLIINPKSGKNIGRYSAEELVNLFESKGYAADAFVTTAAGDATKFASKANGYDLVVCYGGDGTFAEVLNGTMKNSKKPNLGFIPAGTTNDLANALSLPMEPKKALEVIHANNYRPNDAGLINGERYFSYVAVFGAFSQCSYDTEQNLKNKIGRYAYFYNSVKDLSKIRPIPMRVEADGFEDEGEYVFGSFSNSYTIGKFIKLDKDEIDLNDGMFEVFLAKNPGRVKNWAKVLTDAPRKKFDDRFIKLFKTNKVKFTVLDGRSVPWSLDGEFGGSHLTVDASVIHNAYNIITPPLI
ncbi:MAG: diacylglycerol kinase family lipid kinase [Clostridiales bacterium]|nr:diacylglycerol kinase family lipid kinase [Clostridiales bacterium]